MKAAVAVAEIKCPRCKKICSIRFPPDDRANGRTVE
nr:MAG TPA: cysteine-rich protein [Caudoviricetes sp.]